MALNNSRLIGKIFDQIRWLLSRWQFHYVYCQVKKQPSSQIMKLKLNCNDIFAEEISDECAYHLTQFFKNLAFAFEAMHLFQISRHKNNMTHNKIEGDNNSYPFLRAFR